MQVNTESSQGREFPTWLEELSKFPTNVANSHTMYCTRGYAFKNFQEDRMRPTSDYGVSTQSGDLVYYGVLREILEIHYPGLLDLRCVAFLCDWYDPLIGSGVRHDQFGVTSVNGKKRLQKYDPFILASQADQVSFIAYILLKCIIFCYYFDFSFHGLGVLYPLSSSEKQARPLDYSDVDLSKRKSLWDV